MGRFGVVGDALPAVAGGDGLAVVGEWVAGSPVRQAAAADAAVEAWEAFDWPEAIRSHTAFVSTDGTTVLHWSHVTGREAFSSFAGRTAAWAARVEEAVPGLERRRATPVAPYRRVAAPGVGPGEAARGVVGCLAIAEFEVPAADGRAEALVDAVVAATAGDLPPGLVAANFFVSLDGTRIVDYAEWADAASHEAYTRAPALAPVAEVVEGSPDVRFVGVRRYDWWRSARAPGRPAGRWVPLADDPR